MDWEERARYEALEMEKGTLLKLNNLLKKENARLCEACEVAIKMLDGMCQHGYDTRGSARGCDKCYEQIVNAL